MATRFLPALLLAGSLGLIAARPALSGDWPMWGGDAARSTTTQAELPDDLHLHWVRRLPPPRRAWPPQMDDQDKLAFDQSYSPVVLGNTLVVSSMSTDSVTAYALDDGRELWRYYADGPARLAPAAWNGRVYAVADDGFLHCLEAATGRLLWKADGRAAGHRVLGNGRVISMWPARGGAVVADGTVYFASGVWPFLGTFVMAVDADTGAIRWANTGHSTEWQRQPHPGAYAFAGIAPQGYLAVAGDRLVVSGGRSLPALFDRRDGRLIQARVDGKSVGGYRVAIEGELYRNHGQFYHLHDGSPAAATAGAARLSQHVRVAHDPALNPGPGSYTFEAWVKVHGGFDGGDGWDLTVAKRAPNGYYIGTRRGHGWNFMLRDDDGKRTDTQSDRPIPDVYDQWIFLQAVVDRELNRQVLRVHDPRLGTWEEASVAPPPGSIGTAADLYLGMDVDAGRFQSCGELGPVRFWRLARTPADAEADMNRAPSGTEPGLVAAWGFDAVDGETLRDRTPAARHGAVSGARWRRFLDTPDAPQPPADGSLLLNQKPESDRTAGVKDWLDGEVFESFVAQNRLVVVTLKGTLHCFGADVREVVEHSWSPVLPALRNDAVGRRAADILERSGHRQGHALFLGVGDGNLIEQVALRSELHVVGIDADAARVDALRRRFAAAGLYGSRVALIHDDPGTAHYPATIASLVVLDTAALPPTGPDALVLETLYERLRPYDGMAFLAVTAETREAWRSAVAAIAPANGRTAWTEDAIVLTRAGPLPGAGEWTHQYGDAAQTVMSRDERVRPPFGPIWFGSGGNDAVLPRHGNGPRPQVAGGRLVILGVEGMSARDVFTGRELWRRAFPGIGHPFTNLEMEARWAGGAAVFMHAQPRTGATYIGSPVVTLADAIYVRRDGAVFRLDPATGNTVAEWRLPCRSAVPPSGDWGHVSVCGETLLASTDPDVFGGGALGASTDDRWDGTSSRRLVALNRHTGQVAWMRDAAIGFRHNAIAAGGGRLFVADLLSEQALALARRRGAAMAAPPALHCLDLHTGAVLWSIGNEVFGTFLSYSEDHDVLIEGGGRGALTGNPDEPTSLLIARRGRDGTILWRRDGAHQGPLAMRGDMLISGRPGGAISLLTGTSRQRRHPITGEEADWGYWKAYGCGMANAAAHVLLFRSGAAGFADLEHDGGTGTLGGFRSGCTASMIPADGVLSAPDYTRTCTCAYQNQTSMGLIHMPEMELWTVNPTIQRVRGPIRHLGLNLGAPGDRRADNGTLWTPWPRTSAPAPELTVLLTAAGYADVPVRIISATASTDLNRATSDPPANTLDGDASSHWEVSSDANGRFNQWLAYTLNQPVVLDQVAVAWQGPQATGFRLETSLDGEAWALVGEEQGTGQGRQASVYRFSPVSAAHVRLVLGTHGDPRTDSRGRRLAQTARVYDVRLGNLAEPHAYAHFRHRVFRRHSLLVEGKDGPNWIASSGVRDLRRLEVLKVNGEGRPHTVVLHFAEPDRIAAGERVFDIFVQGRCLAARFDVVRAAGGTDKAVVASFPGVSIADSLVVELRPTAGSLHQPILCGVELRVTEP